MYDFFQVAPVLSKTTQALLTPHCTPAVFSVGLLRWCVSGTLKPSLLIAVLKWRRGGEDGKKKSPHAVCGDWVMM